MSKYEIPFLTACIQAFGRRFSMTRQAAYHYLQKHKGLVFLIEFYDVEHLQSMDENPLPLLYQSGYLTLKSINFQADTKQIDDWKIA